MASDTSREARFRGVDGMFVDDMDSSMDGNP